VRTGVRTEPPAGARVVGATAAGERRHDRNGVGVPSDTPQSFSSIAR
jgi:hypothetical protein